MIDVDYIGMGPTPADAQLAAMARQTGALGDKIKPDPEASTYYWFGKNSDGTIRVLQAPRSFLRQDVIALYSQRSLTGYNWREARREELERFIKIYSSSAQGAAANQEIDKLIKSRRELLARLGEINAQLKSALESANRAAQNSQLLSILAVGAKFGSAALDVATNGLSESDAAKVRSETTFEGAQAALDAIRKQAESSVKDFYDSLTKQQQQGWQLDFNLESGLKERNYPVENLPPENPPPINPRLP